MAVALSVAALFAVLIVAALGLRARRLAAEQANLSREIGEGRSQPQGKSDVAVVAREALSAAAR